MKNQYFGHYDADGNYIGFYTSDIWHEKDIPKPYIELSKKEWIQARKERCFVENGKHKPKPYSKTEMKEMELIAVRLERNERLAASDWSQFEDADLSEQDRKKWKDYRQALRDVTKKYPYKLPSLPKTSI